MRACLLALSVAVAGCATSGNPPGWQSKHPDWHPPQGLEYAKAQCDAKAEGAGGYDWIDAALNKSEIRAACMKAYGYE